MNYTPNASEKTSLDYLISDRLQGGDLCLFASNYTPQDTDVAATYDAIKATFGGYAEQTCSGWSAAFTNGDGQAETDEAIHTFTATGAGLPETIYGVYYLDAAGLLVYAELFETGGITLSAAGHVINYLPVYTVETV